jgi:hypothetical protein
VGEDCIAVEARASLSVLVGKVTSRVGLPPGFAIPEPNEKSQNVGKAGSSVLTVNGEALI